MNEPRASRRLDSTGFRGAAARRWLGLGVMSGALLAGCAGTTSPPAKPGLGPDSPVPASEPRAELGLRLDLEPLRDCEERFDLALYENRAVELVAWDEHHDRCERRRAVIRYLSRLTNDEAIFEAARGLALRAEREPGASPAPGASSTASAATRAAPSANAERGRP
jgi:hypothetical protein